jgi:hypothetical protein
VVTIHRCDKNQWRRRCDRMGLSLPERIAGYMGQCPTSCRSGKIQYFGSLSRNPGLSFGFRLVLTKSVEATFDRRRSVCHISRMERYTISPDNSGGVSVHVLYESGVTGFYWFKPPTADSRHA